MLGQGTQGGFTFPCGSRAGRGAARSHCSCRNGSASAAQCDPGGSGCSGAPAQLLCPLSVSIDCCDPCWLYPKGCCSLSSAWGAGGHLPVWHSRVGSTSQLGHPPQSEGDVTSAVPSMDFPARAALGGDSCCSGATRTALLPLGELLAKHPLGSQLLTFSGALSFRVELLGVPRSLSQT